MVILRGYCFGSLALLLALNCPGANLALANEPSSGLRVVKTATKGQFNQRHPINVPLANGYGVTLSFLSSNQVITKAWLDNPSFVVVDGDGCLQGLPGGANCSGQGAKVLHLKRINDLKIPGLPSTNTSLLTVITSGPGGGGIYIFKVNKSSNPGELVYEIIPPTPSPQQQVVSPLIRQLEKGIKKASQPENIDDWKTIMPQVRRVFISLKQGLSLNQSLNKFEVSWEVIGQILELGEVNEVRSQKSEVRSSFFNADLSPAPKTSPEERGF